MNKVLLIITFFMQYFFAFATIQRPDIIIYNGKEYDIDFSVWPLEEYFREFPEKRPVTDLYTNLWRGYIATFEIIQNELWVIDIKIIDDREGIIEAINPDGTFKYRSIINEIFNGNNRIIIDWFNGMLILPQFNRVELARLCLSNNANEYYIKLDIQNGIVLNESIMTRDQYIEYEKERLKNMIEFIPIFNLENNEKSGTTHNNRLTLRRPFGRLGVHSARSWLRHSHASFTHIPAHRKPTVCFIRWAGTSSI